MTATLRVSWIGVGVFLLASAHASEPVANWPLDTVHDDVTPDAVGGHHATVRGAPKAAPGVEGLSLKFDGVSDYLWVPHSDALHFPDATFSLAAWVNVYALNRGQQMVVARNVYSANHREWGLMVDYDNRFRFYLYYEGWQTVGSVTEPRPGHWYHLALTVDRGDGRLYVNGELEGQAFLGSTVPATPAPLTVGGVNDGGNLRQMLRGAVDEVRLYAGVITPEEVRQMAARTPDPHPLPPAAEPYPLWGGAAFPAQAAIPVLDGVEFHVIKPWEFDTDGYRFLHGVALAWHGDTLYASFGHNRGGENTATEEARGRASADGGKTWGEVFTIDPGERDLAVSHGVFLSTGGALWAFHGAYYGTMERVHTRAYLLDEATGDWQAQGVVVEGGFWPMQEALKMADGNWIMSGIRVGGGNPAAVAISRGDDLAHWDLVVIPPAEGTGRMWGESSVILDDARVINVARYGAHTQPLVAVSGDYGRTWTPSRPANMPMAASKPYTGTLSTGRHYLVCTTAADAGNRRAPLTIALTPPGEARFTEVFIIRDAVHPDGPGESHPGARLAYPYAVEHRGHLYVAYSNSGGRGGTERIHWNNNSAELAVIPLAALEADDGS